MALTCDRCLRGDTTRCRCGDCANYLRKKASGWKVHSSAGKGVRRRPSPPRPYVPTGRPMGRPYGVRAPRPMVHAAAEALCEGADGMQVARMSGLTYQQVRTVKRHLLALKGAA